MVPDLAPPPPGWDYLARYAEVTARVRAAEVASGRAGAGVRILVATKSWDDAAIRAMGVVAPRIVGENRVQELVAKGPSLRATGARIHLIGPLQGNKARDTVALADCVESVDGPELAERLSRLCVEFRNTLEVMIQVNVSGELSKSGVAPEAALDLAQAVAVLPALQVTGFMTIGLNSRDEDAVRAGFAILRGIRDRALVLGERGDAPGLESAWELSMGMSGDLDWAIAEGATIVRVGSAIMGRRNAH